MKLVLRPGGFALAGVVALEIVATGVFVHARHDLGEQELTARIQSEANPTRRARLEIQLGDLKLRDAIAAYDHDHFDTAPKLLEVYSGWMKRAWDLLEKSGRDAGRKPQGFKDLDIALREHARQLEDLKHRTPYQDRENVEHIAAEIDALHTQVLSALFPGAQLNESAPPAPAQPASPPSPAPALRPGDPPS